jgi:S1-C subfamily serine protease
VAPPESYLGIETTALERLESEFEEEPGLTVVKVVENSPAAAAGFEVGDRVLTLDEEPLRSPQHLERLVATSPPGTRLTLEVERERRVLVLRPRTVPRLEPRPPPPPARFLETQRLGVEVATLSADESEAHRLPLGEGVKVASFYAGSPLEAAGLERGEVIWKLDGEPLYGPIDFQARVRATEPYQRIGLETVRGRERHALELRTSKRNRSLKYFHFPGVVIYEADPLREETTFGLLLNLFKFTRQRDERTYRIFYFIKWTTGDNEELRPVTP